MQKTALFALEEKIQTKTARVGVVGLAAGSHGLTAPGVSLSTNQVAQPAMQAERTSTKPEKTTHVTKIPMTWYAKTTHPNAPIA